MYGKPYVSGEIIGPYTGRWIRESELLVAQGCGDNAVPMFSAQYEESSIMLGAEASGNVSRITETRTGKQRTRYDARKAQAIERIAGEWMMPVLDSEVVYEGRTKKQRKSFQEYLLQRLTA